MSSAAAAQQTAAAGGGSSAAAAEQTISPAAEQTATAGGRGGTAADPLDPEWEYAPLRIPSEVTSINAAVRLALHAEYGGWELARVRRYTDGSRQVLLRRKRRPAEVLPMPGLIG